MKWTNSRKHHRPHVEITSKQQLAAMTAVDAISTLVVIGASHLFLDDVTGPDWKAALLLEVLVVGVVWLQYSSAFWRLATSIFNPETAETEGVPEGDAVLVDSGRLAILAPSGQGTPQLRLQELFQKISVVIFGVWMVMHFAYLSQYSGGTLSSPFAQLSIAAALMAPYVTNTFVATWSMWALSVVAFWQFSYPRIDGFHVPTDEQGLRWCFVLILAYSTAISIWVAHRTGSGKRKLVRVHRERSGLDRDPWSFGPFP